MRATDVRSIIVAAARSPIESDAPLISAIFPYPTRLRALLAPTRLADALSSATGHHPMLPRAMREWLELLPPFEDASALPVFREGGQGVRSASDGPAVIVHHGCVAQVLAPSANLNSERALQAAGFRVLLAYGNGLLWRVGPACGQPRARAALRAGQRARDQAKRRGGDRLGGLGMLGRDRGVRLPAARRSRAGRRRARGCGQSQGS